MPHTETTQRESVSSTVDSKQSVDTVESVVSKVSDSGSTGGSNGESTASQQTNPNPKHLVIDTMVSSDSIRTSVVLSRRNKDNAANIGVMLFLWTLAFVNFYFAVSYSSNSETSGCVKGAYTIDVHIFCLLAGTTSLPLSFLSVMMWRKGRNSDNIDNTTSTSPRHRSNESSCFSKVGVGKAVFCISFWNLILAVIGVLMYIGQFSDECRAEPIAIVILSWCTFQFSLMCMSVGACCYLTYYAAAQTAKAAEDVMGAGAVFAA